jgi:IS30 family transposase
MTNIKKLITQEDRDEIFNYLKYQQYPDDYTKDQKRMLRRKCVNIILSNDIIKYVKSANKHLLVIFAFETDKIKNILDMDHHASHYGIVKMTSIINQKYYGVPKEAITNYVNACEHCSNFVPLRTIEDMNFVQINQKYDRYVIDCVDLRRYSVQNQGYSWILNIVDSFSKHLWSYKLKTKSANEVTEALEDCFLRYGPPTTIQADNGKEFRNSTLVALCASMNIQIIHGRPRNPKAQGMVERVNQTIKRWLAKKLHENDSLKWSDFLTKIVYAYNVSIHQSTRKSPFQLFFGRPGFNIPGVTPEIDETGNIAEFSHDQEEKAYAEWILNRKESNMIEPDILAEDDVNESIAQQEILENDARNDALNNFTRYSQRATRNANSNLISHNITVGDHVKIALDFDNNPQTRRYPFDSFFEENNFEVLRILQNNMVEIRNLAQPGIIRIVFKGRLKKIKR